MRITSFVHSAGLALAGVLVFAATAAASTPIVSGQLTDPSGRPVTGTVLIYAWPHGNQAMDLPLVGQAQTDANGNFAVYPGNDAQLLQLAAQRKGWLDFIAVGDTAANQGQWVFSSYITGAAGQVQSDMATSSDVSTPATAARAAAAQRPPRINIVAKQPSPELTARAAQEGPVCTPRYQMQKPTYTSSWAVIGELNNAYNDGTTARFTYARENEADTTFGVMYTGPGGANVQIGGDNHISDTGTLSFPPVRQRWSRQLKTKFEFERQAARTDSCARWSVYIRATGWLLGTNYSTKERGTLDKCDKSWVGGVSSGSTFTRSTSAATTWSHGAAAFGVWLTTQSGFSRNVTVQYDFKGRRNAPHYLCGSDGRHDPSTSARIFSGAA